MRLSTAPGPTVSLWHGRLPWAIGHSSAYLGPAADQLDDRLRLGKGGPVAPGPTAGNRYGWLLEAIGRTSAQLGPAAAQSAHPCLERLLSLGLAYPGTNPPTVAPKAVKVPRSLDRGAFAVFNLSPISLECFGLIECVIPSSTDSEITLGRHGFVRFDLWYLRFLLLPFGSPIFCRFESFITDFLPTVTSANLSASPRRTTLPILARVVNEPGPTTYPRLDVMQKSASTLHASLPHAEI